MYEEQQRVDAIAVLAAQVVSFHSVVLFQVTNHGFDGRHHCGKNIRDRDQQITWPELASSIEVEQAEAGEAQTRLKDVSTEGLTPKPCVHFVSRPHDNRW